MPWLYHLLSISSSWLSTPSPRTALEELPPGQPSRLVPRRGSAKWWMNNSSLASVRQPFASTATRSQEWPRCTRLPKLSMSQLQIGHRWLCRAQSTIWRSRSGESFPMNGASSARLMGITSEDAAQWKPSTSCGQMILLPGRFGETRRVPSLRRRRHSSTSVGSLTRSTVKMLTRKQRLMLEEESLMPHLILWSRPWSKEDKPGAETNSPTLRQMNKSRVQGSRLEVSASELPVEEEHQQVEHQQVEHQQVEEAAVNDVTLINEALCHWKLINCLFNCVAADLHINCIHFLKIRLFLLRDFCFKQFLIEL